MLPPSPVVPVPTERITCPPWPCVAALDSNCIAPLEPLLEVPVEKLRKPLMPFVPALTECIKIPPLDLADPAPVDIEM